MRRVCVIVVAGSVLAGCTNWVPTEAMVTSIDRKCMIVESRSTGSVEDRDGNSRTVSEQRTYEGRCDEVEGWAEEKAKRSMTIDGKADIHLSYTAPDGKSHTGTIHVTGRDKQFYDLSTGGLVSIQGDKDNPERISFS